jgi:hypothetical protein
MADSFSEFLADHRAEHRSAFNRQCLFVGDSLQVIGVLVVLRGHWRAGALTVAVGLGVATAGHVRDGNVPKSLETTRLHPVWNLRGDIAIAKDVITETLRNKEGSTTTATPS